MIGTSDGHVYEDEVDAALGPEFSVKSPIIGQNKSPQPEAVKAEVTTQNTGGAKQTAEDVLSLIKQAGYALIPDYLKPSEGPPPVPTNATEGKIPSESAKLMQAFPDVLPIPTSGASKALFLGVAGAKRLLGEETFNTMLSRAEKHLAAGGEELGAKALTGFEKGAEGMWRYELGDQLMKLNPKSLKAIDPNEEGLLSRFGLNEYTDDLSDVLKENPTHAKLGEYLNHNRFFQAYPEAKDVNVFWLDQIPGEDRTVEGLFDPKLNAILLKRGQTMEEAKDTVIHEMQHWIQKKEGLPMNVVKQFSEAEQGEGRTSLLYNHFKSNLEKVNTFLKEGKTQEAQDLADKLSKSADKAFYRSLSSEAEAFNASRRMKMSEFARRMSLGEETEEFPRSEQRYKMPTNMNSHANWRDNR